VVGVITPFTFEPEVRKGGREEKRNDQEKQRLRNNTNRRDVAGYVSPVERRAPRPSNEGSPLTAHAHASPEVPFDFRSGQARRKVRRLRMTGRPGSPWPVGTLALLDWLVILLRRFGERRRLRLYEGVVNVPARTIPFLANASNPMPL
jgi:hypothetical protein